MGGVGGGMGRFWVLRGFEGWVWAGGRGGVVLVVDKARRQLTKGYLPN